MMKENINVKIKKIHTAVDLKLNFLRTSPVVLQRTRNIKEETRVEVLMSRFLGSLEFFASCVDDCNITYESPTALMEGGSDKWLLSSRAISKRSPRSSLSLNHSNILQELHLCPLLS